MNSLLQRANSYLALAPKPDTSLYLLAVPPLIIASISTHVWASDLDLILKYAAANFLSFLCLFVVYAISKNAVRPIRNNYLLPIAFFGLLLGLMKGLTTALFVVWIGVEADIVDALTVRIAAPVIGMWLALTLAFTKAALADMEQTQQLLLNEKKRRAQPSSVPELDRFLAAAQELARKTPSSSTQLVTLILDLVNRGVRPLSHELMERRTLNAVSLWGLLRLGTRARFQPVIGAMLFAISLSSPLARVSAPNVLLGLAISFAMAVVLLSLANLLKQKLPKGTIPQLIALVLTCLLIGSLVLFTLGGLSLISTPVIAIGIFSASWWLGSTLVILGMIRAGLSERRLLTEQIEELMEIDSRKGLTRSALQRREIANYLHSHVQNKLLAQALRIEKSSKVDLEAEMAMLRTNLSVPQFSEAESVASLESLIASWAGTVSIRATCTVEPSDLVLAVIEEAVTNAFRHGKASEVQVHLDNSQLCVTDNGFGPVSGKAGLGSLAFQQLGQWSLSPGELGGAELRISLS